MQYAAPKWLSRLDIHIEAMEKALNLWVEDNAQRNMPLSGPLIHEKAKHVCDHLAGVGGAANMSDAGMSEAGMSGRSPFQAIKGWFDCFKKR